MPPALHAAIGVKGWGCIPASPCKKHSGSARKDRRAAAKPGNEYGEEPHSAIGEDITFNTARNQLKIPIMAITEITATRIMATRKQTVGSSWCSAWASDIMVYPQIFSFFYETFLGGIREYKHLITLRTAHYITTMAFTIPARQQKNTTAFLSFSVIVHR